ncbi:rhodanese-like domain-containing protein [Kocuria rhizophila]|uniref:rhodanese-like domain-containing protein n=1 Tax=Kocuria rhizophila TaxID=72000 RepID=UPI0002DCE73D|nr:rhodanese-like domain-containing protein [Kocuria rhizophila]
MSAPTTVSAPELQDPSETGPLFLDVRTPVEFTISRIPGSVNVPLALIEKHTREISRLLPRDTVVVCRSGARSAQAAELLAAEGVTSPAVLTGGIDAWRESGRTVQAGREHWDLERQVRLTAGSLVLSGVLASTVVPRAKWFAAAIGGGLVFAAVSNTCAMGQLLSALPYNQRDQVTLEDVRRRLA